MGWIFKKMVAPVIFTVITVLACAAYLVGLVYGTIGAAKESAVVMGGVVAAGGILLLSAGISLYVLIERIREIRSGEEDDLSQY